jgi:hypothetical protein
VKPDIKLDTINCTTRYGNGGSRIKPEAFELRVLLEIRLEIIKAILTRLGNKNMVPAGRFIPYELVQTIRADVYKNMLRMQNEFLTNYQTIPVFGIAAQAFKHVFNTFDDDGHERQTTAHNYIVANDSIQGIEFTNRAANLDKLFILSDATGILTNGAFVDNALKELFKSGAIPSKSIHQHFNPP